MPGFKPTLDEWKKGKLHSGSKKGPVVRAESRWRMSNFRVRPTVKELQERQELLLAENRWLWSRYESLLKRIFRTANG